MNDINTTSWNNDTKIIWGMLPFFSIISLFSKKEYTEITRKEAEGILRNRFANGNISCEEYTERMARL